MGGIVETRTVLFDPDLLVKIDGQAIEIGDHALH